MKSFHLPKSIKIPNLILPKGVIVRFVLIALDEIIIGNFDLSEETRTWSFKYDDGFFNTCFMPLEEFPEIGHTYGHEACTRWLASRITANEKTTKGFSFAEAINRKSEFSKSALELHMVH